MEFTSDGLECGKFFLCPITNLTQGRHKPPITINHRQEGRPCTLGLKRFGLMLVYGSLCNTYSSASQMECSLVARTGPTKTSFETAERDCCSRLFK